MQCTALDNTLDSAQAPKQLHLQLHVPKTALMHGFPAGAVRCFSNLSTQQIFKIKLLTLNPRTLLCV